MLRRQWRRAVAGAAGLGLVGMFLTLGRGQTTPGPDGPAFPQPEVRRSAKGILRTTLHARLAVNRVQDPTTGDTRAIETPTYEGTIPGPTLRVKPGDMLDLQLVNALPPNPPEQRLGEFPHDPYTTNLHTHGMTVSPQGIGDNVLREMAPGTTNPIRIPIPADHQTGTFWYHPHKHGAVSFQVFGGMAGLLIVEGGPGTLDHVPEVKAATEVVMAFQALRTDPNGQVPFVNPAATHLGTNLNLPDPEGLWSTLATGDLYVTTNGVTNPTLSMRPGEVQRWRWLNAASSEHLVLALQGHPLHLLAHDGITIPQMRTLAPGDPYVMGAGQRVDLLVQAGPPGTYLLQAVDPADPQGWSVVSGSGLEPAPRNARIGGDFPPPTYPITLATIVVAGAPRDMRLPAGPLPVPQGLPSLEAMLQTPPDAVRRVAFENCGQRASMQAPDTRLPTCGWYFARYDAPFWGGTPFTTLNMMRDDEDQGVPTPDPAEPLADFAKEALFSQDQPLFDDMRVGNMEEWTVVNRSFSDHVFHIHQNPFLLTHVNGQPLPVPEWHDTIIVPAAQPQPGTTTGQNINAATFGSITFRTRFDPDTVGSFVMHCHILPHEDIGMMQRLEIVDPARPGGASSPRPHH
jgi:FtsP/CotA-like multicopper oxidase with cupredoxin domain